MTKQNAVLMPVATGADLLTVTVDQLGTLKARISRLQEQEANLKAVLVASGETEIDGRRYRATVAMFDRTCIDMDAARRKLGKRWVREHSTTQPQTRVGVVARKT
jgi:hypothetical protein